MERAINTFKKVENNKTTPSLFDVERPVLIKKTGTVGTLTNGVIKSAVTAGVITAGFVGGSALDNLIVDKTDNVILGKVAKYGTVFVSAVAANMIDGVIDNTLKYQRSTTKKLGDEYLLDLMEGDRDNRDDIIPPNQTQIQQ